MRNWIAHQSRDGVWVVLVDVALLAFVLTAAVEIACYL